MSRKDDLVKILSGLDPKDIKSVQNAADKLDSMFKKVEGDLTDAKKKASDAADDAQGKGDGEGRKITLEYETVTESLIKGPKKALDVLKTVFWSYKSELKNSLAATQTMIPQINRLTMQQVETFADFKGMSLDAQEQGKKGASLLQGIQEGLLTLYTPDQVRKQIVSLTKSFQDNFPMIRYESKENEAAFFRMGATLNKLGVSHEAAGDYFKTLRVTAGASAGEINQVTNGLLEVSKATGRPLDEARKNFVYFVKELGYSKEKAFEETKKLAIQQQKTGLGAETLGNVFGRQMDTFDSLANKTAELNAVFGVSLNPQEMIDMTAAERNEYITEALRASGMDLSNRLVQRQVEDIFGGNITTRQYLTSIENTSNDVSDRIAAAEAKIAKIRLASQAKTDGKQQEQAQNEMSRVERMELLRQRIAQKGRILAAGSVDQIEKDAYATAKVRFGMEEHILGLMEQKDKDGVAYGDVILKAAHTVRRAQAMFGTVAGTVIGGVQMTKDLTMANVKEARKKLIADQKSRTLTKAETKFLESTKQADKVSMKNYATATERLLSNFGADQQDQARAILAKSELFVDETADEKRERLKKAAQGAADKVVKGAEKTWEGIKTDLRNMTAAFKTQNRKIIITNVNGDVMMKGYLKAGGGTTAGDG